MLREEQMQRITRLGFNRLSDAQLTRTITTNQAKVNALRLASTAVGVELYRQYRDALDLARAELERRRI